MKRIFNNKKILYLVLTIVIILIVGGSFISGYYLAQNNIKNEKSKKEELIKTQEALKELQKLVDENIKKNKKEDKNKTNLPKEKVVNSEFLDYKENLKKEQNKTPHIKEILYTNKPKLVIIMDDMSFNSQVLNLKNLHINITPSFFPPTTRHPNTAKYAKEFTHFMVHFPMQATNPNFREEDKTLHIDSSLKFIEKRVSFIKKEFPTIRFVNNHTGSKFTSNYKAMNRLYKVLNQNKIIFVDSRTISSSKAPILAKKYHKILLSRDVFLDNKADVSYIKNQLKQAVKIAERRGYAIAICHPHSKTFEALKKSKDILKKVEVIYIDELYKLYQQHKLSKL